MSAAKRGLYMGWLVAAVQLLISLCDWLAAPIRPGILLDYAQSFVLLVVFAGLFYFGRLVCQIAYPKP